MDSFEFPFLYKKYTVSLVNTMDALNSHLHTISTYKFEFESLQD